MEVVLVGELNPYGINPRHALFDVPVNSSGWRLRHLVFQVTRRTYFSFQRHNLCTGKWSNKEAEREAARLYLRVYDSRQVDATFILLGKKVASAFGYRASDPFTRNIDYPGTPGRIVFLPHPSGLCRVWGDPTSYARAQEVLRAALPDLPWGELNLPQDNIVALTLEGDNADGPPHLTGT